MPVIKGWKFPIQIDDDTGKIKTVEDNESVKQSVKLILKTYRRERKIFPNFGSDFRSFMFEVMDPPILSTLKNTTESTIKTWEPHISSMNISVKADNGAVSSIKTAIDYVTDIEPTQERLVNESTVTDK